ncbi:FecR family protein [Haliscomenobacter sp.]|uniref:FecR family protein n=1 Tax=Haliscomenobacter sp. TaxID=2717303 RepID=UPI003BAD6CE8
MSKEKYQALLAKYLNGECSDEERALLDQWYAELEDVSKTVPETVDPVQKAAFLEKNWETLLAKTHLDTLQSKSKQLWWRWLAAASVLLILGASYFWFNHSSPSTTASQDLEVHKNTATQTKVVKLSDGSIVHLEPNASLVLDANFGKQLRAVQLEGEAFFEVARNPKIPFLVRSGNLVTEVLGTSFRIKPQVGQKTIEVSVLTGRVSVYAQETPKTQKLNGVILTPNQKVIFDTDLKTIRQGIVDRPQLIIADLPKSNFQFDESTLEKVAGTLQSAYGVEIVIVNPSIRNCAFTGDLNGLSLQEQLAFICGSINAEFEIRGSTVFILGSSCN